jgi:hypothetical protein
MDPKRGRCAWIEFIFDYHHEFVRLVAIENILCAKSVRRGALRAGAPRGDRRCRTALRAALNFPLFAVLARVPECRG